MTKNHIKSDLKKNLGLSLLYSFIEDKVDGSISDSDIRPGTKPKLRISSSLNLIKDKVLINVTILIRRYLHLF